MKKKTVDIQAILIYIVMVVLVLFIALPPIFRMTLKEETKSKLPQVPSLTALVCKKQVIIQQVQYDISTNSTYQDELERVTFTYQSSNVSESQTTNEGENQTNNIVPPTTDANLNVTTTPLTETNIQEEIQNLKSIDGIEVEEGDNMTRLVLTKKVASTLEETSPYRNYFQSLENQQLFFEQNGYNCQVIRN